MEKESIVHNEFVKVTNRSDSVIFYSIPERNVRREFNRKETKMIPYQELIDYSSRPGARELIYNYLYIEDKDILQRVLNINAEPEYYLNEDMIKTGWLEGCTLDQFKDALDFAPTGVKDLIKHYAVSLPLNDVAKREAIKEMLNFDVTAAIENERASKEDDTKTEELSTNKRRANPTYSTATSKYKVVGKSV